MTTKKKNAKKTKTVTTTALAPREVWLVIDDADQTRRPVVYEKKSDAKLDLERDSERVVGPYVLAERRRER